MLPDGTCVDVSELDYTGALAEHEASVGQGTGSDPTGGGSFPPYVAPTYPPATTTGPAATSSDVDALDLQWQAIQSVMAAPPSPAPPIMLTDWQRDYGNWQSWVTGYRSRSAILQAAQVTGLPAWQDLANEWGGAVKATWPTLTPPPNFPTGAVGLGLDYGQPGSLSSLGGLSGIGSSLATALEWIVIAVVVGAGVWLLWPVLAHTAV